MNAPWYVTRAAGAAGLGGAVVLVVGALAGRADVAVLGAVGVLAVAVDLARRPSGPVRATLAPDEPPDVPGALRARVAVTGPPDAIAAQLTTTRGGRPALAALVALRGGERDVDLVVRTVRTGPQEVVTAAAQGVGAGSASVGDVSDAAERDTVVLPAVAPLLEVSSSSRLRGLTGAHRSPRPGEGGDLRDVHPFTPGDRLRRIDWRVTARRSPDLSEPYVRREHALGEAVVVLVVDSRDDVGPDPRTWSLLGQARPDDATSLDIARTAAASVARAVLAAGDRVGLDDLGVLRRPLTPGGGRRQLGRIRHALALTHPEGDAAVRVRSPRVPSGALVVVFSTFLDDEAARAVAGWRQAGHRVLAVDVLPPLRTRALIPRDATAVRLVLLEREDRLADLRDVDVDVVRWRDDPAVVLAALARRDRRRAGTGAAR